MAFYPNNPDLHSFQKEINLCSLGQGLTLFMSPNPEGGGIFCFWCGSHWCWCRSLFRFCALSSEPVAGFDQTCIETLLGGGEELIRIW